MDKQRSLTRCLHPRLPDRRTQPVDFGEGQKHREKIQIRAPEGNRTGGPPKPIAQMNKRTKESFKRREIERPEVHEAKRVVKNAKQIGRRQKQKEEDPEA